MSNNLKPCPFCGASNTHMTNGWLDGRYSEEEWCQVECQWCCAAGPSKPFKYQAAEAWNNAGAATARAEAAEQRAEAAEAEAERLRSAIAETLQLADIYAGVAAHNAKAEPETAGEAWRSPYMATMRELRRALGGAA